MALTLFTLFALAVPPARAQSVYPSGYSGSGSGGTGSGSGSPGSGYPGSGSPGGGSGYGGSSGSSGGSWQVVPCNSDGSTPVNSSSGYGGYSNNNGFQPLTGRQSGTASNSYPKAMKDLAKNSQYAGLLGSFGPSDETAFPYLPAPPATVPAKIFTGYMQRDGIGLATEYSGIWADNGTYPILDADGHPAKDSDGNPLTGNINGSVTIDVSGHLSGYYKVYYGWSYMPNMPMMPPANQPMPDHINLLVSSNLYVYVNMNQLSLWDQGNLSANSTASASGDSISVSADGRLSPYASQSVTKYHLRSVPVVPLDALGGIATVSVDGATHSDASNSVPYNQKISVAGYGVYSHTLNAGANAWSFVQAGSKQDDRAVIASAPGHEPTFHKELLEDDMGNIIRDQYNIARTRAVENKPVGNALQIDIGVPAKSYDYYDPGNGASEINGVVIDPPDTSGSIYPIEYDGRVFGGPNYPNYADNNGDTYHWYSSHTDKSDGATLPFYASPLQFPANDYGIPPLTVTYKAPYVMRTHNQPYSPDENIDVKLERQDADGSAIDHINFHYTFVKDGADASYNLYLHLHMLHENWQFEHTYREDASNTPNAPATKLVINPAAPRGGHPTIYVRNPIPRTVQYAYEGVVVIVAVAGQLLDPDLNAFLAATGVGLSQLAPNPATESLPDTSGDWQDSKKGVNLYNHPELMDPPSLADTLPINDAVVQGGCTYELWERVYNERNFWLGDQYGNNGYVGQEEWVVYQPYSRPIEHRYTLVNPPVDAPPLGS